MYLVLSILESIAKQLLQMGKIDFVCTPILQFAVKNLSWKWKIKTQYVEI